MTLLIQFTTMFIVHGLEHYSIFAQRKAELPPYDKK